MCQNLQGQLRGVRLLMEPRTPALGGRGAKPTQSKASRGWEPGEAATGLLALKAVFSGSFLDAPKRC